LGITCGLLAAGVIVWIIAVITGSETVRHRGEHYAQPSDLHAAAYGEHAELDRRRKLRSIASELLDGAGIQGDLGGSSTSGSATTGGGPSEAPHPYPRVVGAGAQS
jgi:hypothetical protein